MLIPPLDKVRGEVWRSFVGESERQVSSMWVAPEARNRGIGTALIEQITDSARREGVRELQLEVTDGNDEALRLYERCGFRLTGRTSPHPRKVGLAEREMRLRL